MAAINLRLLHPSIFVLPAQTRGQVADRGRKMTSLESRLVISPDRMCSSLAIEEVGQPLDGQAGLCVFKAFALAIVRLFLSVHSRLSSHDQSLTEMGFDSTFVL